MASVSYCSGFFTRPFAKIKIREFPDSNFQEKQRCIAGDSEQFTNAEIYFARGLLKISVACGRIIWDAFCRISTTT